MKEFDKLLKSEVKKINKAGRGLIGEYYTSPSKIDGFIDVKAHVFDWNFEHIIAEVTFIVCLFDRRKSWVACVKEVIS